METFQKPYLWRHFKTNPSGHDKVYLGFFFANHLAISIKSITFAAANIANTLKGAAPVAELVDALDLGSSVSRRAGSSPVRRTNKTL